ncbi:HAMP domain-containing histidine kinase [Natronosporangium hydrolyticum]|uniref:histidine kinase n=1 Tax=Natronosporangium hydrolyticum TaxID=2811111 RepID=A0A895YDR7_9ACTN|nr:HAMP domain-containing sensor histidine kinase [Natronosporangium hydrolyticum]QSB15711.1 HAMP domain-containing histidine kinase [Natronosporangium hydrolyticum]
MTGLLRRTPLRVKLVAAVLALVTAALVVISTASTVALRAYLTNRVDVQLAETVQRAQTQSLAEVAPHIPVLPTDYLIDWLLPSTARVTAHDRRYDDDELPPLPADLAQAQELAGDPYTVTAVGGGPRWRAVVTIFPGGTVLTVAQDLSDADNAVSRLVWTEVVVGAAVLALLAGVGVVAVRGSLRPLREIERTAGAIAAGDLSQRVPEPEPPPVTPHTELGRVARALNTMLGQIETAFAARAASEARMRQFVADASHELRTPLTTIRGFAELYRQAAAVNSPAEASRLVRRIEDEAARMGLLVEDLLLLARLDQERPLALAPVELPVIVADTVQAARAIDPERVIELVVEGADEPLVVRGDDARLRQVMSNLLNNATTHTPSGAPVSVRLRAVADHAVIEVADQGPGLSEEQRARVFERFYRLDSARSRPANGGQRPARPAATGAGGTGLGLAIVAALVAAHQGTVEIDETPGGGATFRVRLPLWRDEGNPIASDAAGSTG